jgi:hypothetical protein
MADDYRPFHPRIGDRVSQQTRSSAAQRHVPRTRMHPQVIGRGHRMAMLEELVRHGLDRGVRFARLSDVARELGRP